MKEMNVAGLTPWGGLAGHSIDTADVIVAGIAYDGSAVYRKSAAPAPMRLRDLSPGMPPVTQDARPPDRPNAPDPRRPRAGAGHGARRRQRFGAHGRRCAGRQEPAHLIRHRRPRPRVCARHRDSLGRRALYAPGARLPAHRHGGLEASWTGRCRGVAAIRPWRHHHPRRSESDLRVLGIVLAWKALTSSSPAAGSWAAPSPTS